MIQYIFIALLISCVAMAEEPSAQLEPIMVNPGLNKQGSAESIGQEYIRLSLPNTLRDGVGQVPNVEFTGGPRPEAQLPQIRGLNSDRILILEDGVRQNFQSGHNGRTFGDYSLLEEVEVIKGPWSSLYGSGAMGGVISFRRATAADLFRRTGKQQGVQIALDGGTANASFGQRVTSFAKRSHFEPLISVRQAESHNIRLGDGQRLQDSGSQNFDAYSALTLKPSAAQNFTLKLNRFENRADAPLNPEAPSDAQNLTGKSRIVKQDAVGDYNLAGDRWDFHAKPYYRHTRVKKERLSDGRVDTQTIATTGVDLWNNWRWRKGGFGTVTTVGAEYFLDRADGRRNSQKLASFPDGKGGQLGLYLQPTLSFGRFSVIPGLRYDSYKIEPETGLSNKADNFSAKASADFEYLPSQHIFIGWSQAFNAPRLQDLYISGMHFPGNFFIANPNLKPERADAWEAGTKNEFDLGDSETLALNGTYFRTEARDFIARAVDLAGGTTQFQNRDRVRLEGFELSALYQRAFWGTGFGYGQVRSLDKGTGEPLPDTAADQWTATVQIYPTENLTAGTQMRVARKQDHVQSGQDASPGYFVEDFFVTYSPGRWEFRVRLDNAFDRDYRPHTSAIKATGRDARASVSYLF